jgi:hypothetical protein
MKVEGILSAGLVGNEVVPDLKCANRTGIAATSDTKYNG